MKPTLPSKLNLCKSIGVATSGGIDSMCLLHFMKQKFGDKIVAINIEHGIRGEKSIEESKFVLDYCSKNKILCLQFSVDVPAFCKQNKLSIEDGARKLRYDVFFQLLKDKKVEKIVTAHHRSDRVETMLLSLVRGAGTTGSSSTMQQSEDILRPMIDVPKTEIHLYAQENGIPFITDESNFDNNFNRNFLRNEIVPKLEQLNSSAQKNIASFGERMSLLNQYLLNKAKKFVKKEKNCLKISTKIDDELIFYACKLFNIDIDSKNVEQLAKLNIAKSILETR